MLTDLSDFMLAAVTDTGADTECVMFLILGLSGGGDYIYIYITFENILFYASNKCTPGDIFFAISRHYGVLETERKICRQSQKTQILSQT